MNFSVDDYSIRVKKRIKQERRKKKISQEDMALNLDIGLRTYQEKENPRYPEKCFDIRQMGIIADSMDSHIGILALSDASNRAIKEAEAILFYMQELSISSAGFAKQLAERLATYGRKKGDDD